MSDKGVCRTAPATPGLLIKWQLLFIYFFFPKPRYLSGSTKDMSGFQIRSFLQTVLSLKVYKYDKGNQGHGDEGSCHKNCHLK